MMLVLQTRCYSVIYNVTVLQTTCYSVIYMMLQCYIHDVSVTNMMFMLQTLCFRNMSITDTTAIHIHCNTQTLVLHSSHVNMHTWDTILKFKLYLVIGMEKRQIISVGTSRTQTVKIMCTDRQTERQSN